MLNTSVCFNVRLLVLEYSITTCNSSSWKENMIKVLQCKHLCKASICLLVCFLILQNSKIVDSYVFFNEQPFQRIRGSFVFISVFIGMLGVAHKTMLVFVCLLMILLFIVILDKTQYFLHKQYRSPDKKHTYILL